MAAAIYSSMNESATELNVRNGKRITVRRIRMRAGANQLLTNWIRPLLIWSMMIKQPASSGDGSRFFSHALLASLNNILHLVVKVLLVFTNTDLLDHLRDRYSFSLRPVRLDPHIL